MAVMASRRQRRREGAGKRAHRLSSQALASKLVIDCSDGDVGGDSASSPAGQ